MASIFTGVEVAAELYDLIKEDLPKYYANLIPCARVRLVELQDHILSTYDREISNYTSDLFSRCVAADEHTLPPTCCLVYLDIG